jgi:hypothetical protein
VKLCDLKLISVCKGSVRLLIFQICHTEGVGEVVCVCALDDDVSDVVE